MQTPLPSGWRPRSTVRSTTTTARTRSSSIWRKNSTSTSNLRLPCSARSSRTSTSSSVPGPIPILWTFRSTPTPSRFCTMTATAPRWTLRSTSRTTCPTIRSSWRIILSSRSMRRSTACISPSTTTTKPFPTSGAAGCTGEIGSSTTANRRQRGRIPLLKKSRRRSLPKAPSARAASSSLLPTIATRAAMPMRTASSSRTAS